ncbi:XRE family transcriptional regulator [Helicobacter sp.]|uniref:XRE family transcriptional regulator n=1 Tax=Helicobacter sp. TaxID=218 RepID=UPI002A74B44E|nr:XRE family transcriptional regulator [Helicobacter sp.]MDY2584901.1 XRE family transcriptional regulator [Helicobacter sp.]
MQICKKIREIRGNESQSSFAERFGITARTLQNYEYGNTSPSIDFIQKISQEYDIAPEYFFDYGEKLFRNCSAIVPQYSSSMQKKGSSISKTNITHTNSSPQTLNDDFVSIPFYEDVRASAGSGAYNEAETAEQLNFPKSFLRQYFGLISFNNLSIIIGKGDSMSPTLPESCYLLVQNGSVNDGEICIARLEDELYVKRLQKRPRLKLISDNKTYDPIELEGENFNIIGRVVGYFKKTAL